MSHVHRTNSIKKYFLLVTLLIFYLERDDPISLVKSRSALEKRRPGLLKPSRIFLALEDVGDKKRVHSLLKNISLLATA